MKAIELKFLLKLLGEPDYRARIQSLNPNPKTPAYERDRTCVDLADREIVSYTYEIAKFKLDPSGKTFLKPDATASLLTEAQLAVLRACQEKAITPGQLKKIPTTDRQQILQDLAAKGFIKADKIQIKEVWLTDRGREYLREECNVKGTSSVISLSLLQNYVNFLRKELHVASVTSSAVFDSTTESDGADHFLSDTAIDSADQPSDENILNLIKTLDQELGTENYLPIFHLRQKLQPPLSREELDQALYRLERSNQIELNSLVEAMRYTSEQIQAGIAQESGGPLFFITVNH